MSSAIADRAKILGTLETLVIGAAGGLLFLWLNLPGGLISGAMVAVGIAALSGRPVTMPPILTQTVLVLLGITLGSLVSRQLIQHMSAYPLTIGLLALATFCSTFGSSFYLQRVHGWDQTSASCDNGNSLNNISVTAGQKVTCTVTNTQQPRGTIVVVKDAMPDDSRDFNFNAAGGLCWGIAIVLAGYFAGESFDRVEKVLGRVAAVVLALVVVVGLVVWQVRRRRVERVPQPAAVEEVLDRPHPVEERGQQTLVEVAKGPRPEGLGVDQSGEESGHAPPPLISGRPMPSDLR